MRNCAKDAFLFGAEGETRKALPCSSLREQPIVFGFAEWSSSLSFLQKNKPYTTKWLYRIYLAQKERLELSRRFPDLRP